MSDDIVVKKFDNSNQIRINYKPIHIKLEIFIQLIINETGLQTSYDKEIDNKMGFIIN